MKYDVVIVASGKGERADLGFNKVFYQMKDGRSVLEHALDLFVADEDCVKIIVVTNPDRLDVIKGAKIVCTAGGKERKDSVANGLALVESGYVLIHDAARPFLHQNALCKIKDMLREYDALVLGHMAIDTLKEVAEGKVIRTIDRGHIFMAETPQAFNSSLIRDCYKRCADVNFTDDASLVESLGHEVHIVIDEYDNPKLTRKEDFVGL